MAKPVAAPNVYGVKSATGRLRKTAARKPPSTGKLLTVAQLAARWSQSVSTVYRLRDRVVPPTGIRLKAFCIGTTIRFPVEVVREIERKQLGRTLDEA